MSLISAGSISLDSTFKDPDPALFVSGFQDAKKNQAFKKFFAYYLFFEGT